MGTGAGGPEAVGDGLNVAAALATLRGDMNAGFARLEGLLTRLGDQQDRTTKDLAELEQRVSALEERRWPVASVAALSGVVSAGVAVLALVVAK